MKTNRILLIFFCTLFLSGTLFVSMPQGNADSLKIALVLWRGETDGERGFKDGLRDLGYSVDYEIFNGEQNIDKLIYMIRKKINYENFDYILKFRSNASTLFSDEIFYDINKMKKQIRFDTVRKYIT